MGRNIVWIMPKSMSADKTVRQGYKIDVLDWNELCMNIYNNQINKILK